MKNAPGTPPSLIVPTTTFLGMMMRISDRALRCDTTARIAADPFSILELRKAIAEEVGRPHKMFDLSPPQQDYIFTFAGVHFEILKSRREPSDRNDV